MSSKITQVFFMGKFGRFPITLTIGDTAFVRCIKSHTLINGIAYPLQLDSTIYITPELKSSVALGYLRNDSMSIYFYDLRLQNECVVVDFNALLEKAGISFKESAEVAAKLSLKTAKDLSNGVRKGATRGLAFILAEIIVTLAAP